ncbi:hypothetical protein M2347_000486 [Chryseobacterium sp. H1D6B]|nr:hypothetical protein [Chryseobacterium sp. H1D6B]MDH6250759.1 hypothetical protein [Chryseobacterium sp. H1D6B]
MEGKQKFDYESAVKKEAKGDEKGAQDIILKIVQVVISIIMAVLHM